MNEHARDKQETTALAAELGDVLVTSDGARLILESESSAHEQVTYTTVSGEVFVTAGGVEYIAGLGSDAPAQKSGGG